MTPEEIRQRATRKYATFLSSVVQGEPFQGYSWPVNIEYADLSTAGRLLLEESIEQRGFGYTLHREARRTRGYGTQTVPVRVSIDSQDDYLKLIGKSREFAAFAQDVALISERLPVLTPWIVKNPLNIVEFHGQWEMLLRVCEYFVAHPRPNLYMRELPVAVDTKFIEDRIKILRALLDAILPPETINWETSDFNARFGLRTEPTLIRVRLLDEHMLEQLSFPADDMTLPLEQMWRCARLAGQRCVLVENKMTFLTLPCAEYTFSIWSKGFMVTEVASIGWLDRCPLYYWGDLDAQGFQMLSALRSRFPNVIAFLMDDKAFELYQAFAGPGTPLPTVPLLPHLTAAEANLYTYLATHNLRLEQERIPHAAVLSAFRELFGEQENSLSAQADCE